jgi:hypothetical protein
MNTSCFQKSPGLIRERERDDRERERERETHTQTNVMKIMDQSEPNKWITCKNM